MAGNDAFLEDLKMRVNIVDVIGKELPLKKSGKNYTCCCPFHHEKTPSFSVNEEKQFYHCFGCGKGGDVISFVMEYHKLDFREAVDKLCDDYGIEKPALRGRNDIHREHYFEINKKAARFFFDELTKKPNYGYPYITGRGLSDRTIAEFGLGYAPNTGDALYRHLKAEGVTEQDMLKLGLIVERRGKYRDKFYHRLMFPIFDYNDHVIGFGGRAIRPDAKPKYLNSAASDIFLKGKNLYAFNFAKHHVKEEGCILLVEGYMDVVSLHQSGIRNVVASLGTALTPDQAMRIGRVTKNVILSYDSDRAGVQAAIRGTEILRAQGITVKVLRVTGGKDPDEFVKKNGAEAFRKLMAEAIPATDFILDALAKDYVLTDDHQVVSYIQRAVTVLAGLGPVEQDLYVRRLSEKFGITEHAVRLELQRASDKRNEETKREQRRSENRRQLEQENTVNEIEEEEDEALLRLEMSLLLLAIQHPRYLRKCEEDGIVFQTKLGKEVHRLLRSLASNDAYGDVLADDIAEALEAAEEREFRRFLDKIWIGPEDGEFYRDCLTTYQQRQWKERKKHLQNELAVAEMHGQEEKIAEILTELQEVEQKMRKGRRKGELNVE